MEVSLYTETFNKMLAYSHTLDVTCCNAQAVPGSGSPTGSGETFLSKPYIFAVKEHSFLQRLPRTFKGAECLLSVIQKLYYRPQESANSPASQSRQPPFA